ncbi:hypothetical protein ACJIZ3_023755 [Penstemon smallii]|uniref:RBR-type E3 ubiquitin transferase n=1 Tax=Penstemon smallii TaxID=265156 RepID=A0ABD3TPX9_9LAMI
MIKYICVKLEENNVGHIKCPAFKCNHELDPFACASLVGPKIFLRWTDVMCETTIAGWEKCYCPYRNCNVLIVNECGKNPKKSKCPNCKRWLCFQCKSVWHAGFKCEESGELRGSNDIAFGRLAEYMGWNRCPRCRHFIEWIWGCRNIKCRCGAQFYYMSQFHRDATPITQRRACLYGCFCFTVFMYLLFAAISFLDNFL